MEVGHITVEVNGWPCHCGRKGCLEAYVSSYGLERFYFMETGECVSSFEVIERAKNRETEALKSIDEMSDYLSVGIASLIHLFNPDVVAISGGIPASYPELLKTTEEKVKRGHLNSHPLTFPSDWPVWGSSVELSELSF